MRVLLAALLALAVRAVALAVPAIAHAATTTVTIPAPDVQLRAAYALPSGPATAPAIVALHGCGGPFPSRDGQWRDALAAAGHPVLLPDSFGSRGLGSQCKVRHRGISPGKQRRSDAVAALEWLATQPGTPKGGLILLGWSNGGSTVLATAAEGVLPAGLVRGFVAFYPGCTTWLKRSEKPGGWAPSAPLLIVMGEDDDWTPAAPCRALAARFPDRIKLTLYPGAYHDFDAPNHPVKTRKGLAFTANNDGIAHAGTNPAAREAALHDVPAWIAGLPATHP